jgi:hypothetical protein
MCLKTKTEQSKRTNRNTITITYVFRDRIRMIDAVDPLGHEHRLLLIGHGLPVFSGDVAETRDHPQTLRYLGMHRSVHVVEQIQSLRDQFVALSHLTRLYFTLSGGVEVVRVGSLNFVSNR